VAKVNEQPTAESTAVTRFWRTLEERQDTEHSRDAADNEFLPETVDDSLPANTLSRRGFLGVFGAAAALATAACTTNHERTIVPYTKRPKEIIPGVANYYASTFSEGQQSFSVLVKTREGRPIHVTGNDEHPRLKGKTSLRAIADVLTLYDSDRVTAPRFEQRPTTWAEAEKALLDVASEAKRSAKSVLLFAGASNSPTRKALLARLQAEVPSLEILQFEPGVGDAARVAAEAVFGGQVQSSLHLERAKVILALGADFLNGDDPEAISAFTAQRQLSEPEAAMSRLWVMEGTLSLTGANADQRFTVRPSRLAGLAFALAAELQKQGVALPAGAVLPKVPDGFVEQQGISIELWHKLVADVVAAKAEAVVISGDKIPAEAQAAAHLLNAMLASRGVEYFAAEPTVAAKDLEAVFAGMDAGKYVAAIFWDSNPAYTLANAPRFAASVGKVQHRFWIGRCADETASLCQWNLPENHWLESWGDFGAGEVLTLRQPEVAPLYDTRQGEDILLRLLRGLGAAVSGDYHAYLVDRWQREVCPGDSPLPASRFFEAALHDGMYKPGSGRASLAFSAQKISAFANAAFEVRASGDFELVLSGSAQLYDGRYANNAWLQELPDPITKNTWGNPLLLSVDDAKTLSVENGDLVGLQVGDTHVETPVLVQPGQAKGVLALPLGYGRKTGTVAKGVGVSAYAFLGADTSSPNLRLAAKLTKLSKHVRLPLTQSHHRMHGRDLVRSFTLEEFAAEHAHPRKKVALTTLYPDQQFPEHKWGMVIDLAACVGCSACVVACQSENNIATVGPEQVERGREMHWIRIDTYYEGSESNPTVVHQPMLCQHCDSAPCENVCPVNATNHSPDGLNQMAYNRCVGTRYCANNCSYKVRRYNFFDYTSEQKEPADLVHNPEVTVRPRGVMEKCSFCVQRIEDVRMRAKAEKRDVRDGEIVTACQSACPSGAIVFGDLKNPETRVSKASRIKRGYKVLEELGTLPAVTYLANLRNPAKAGGSHE